MAHYFPEEIIYEILLRLPVQSLVRFTCVNKSWYSIIKSACFVSAQLAHTNRSDSKNSTHLLVLNPSCETHDPTYITSIVPACISKQAIEQDRYSKPFDEYAELRFPNKRLPPFKVVGSCNGLVLLKCFIDTLILWNPLLRKSVTLPEPHSTDQNDDPDQLRSTGWGFGFDSRTNDCKVVKIVDSLVQVFSLSTGYWKSFKVAAPACRLNHDGGPQPFINGAIHWLASARIGSTGVCRNSILSFDVSNEIFREIMLPERLVPSLTNYCLDPISYSISEYGKSLALCVGATHFLSLWVMKEYGEVESWTEVLNFKTLADIQKPVLGFTRSGKVDYLDIPKPLGFTRSGKVLWEAYTGHVASYDPKSSTFKYHIPEKYGSWGCYLFAGSYVESLVLLNESNQLGSKNGSRRATN